MLIVGYAVVCLLITLVGLFCALCVIVCLLLTVVDIIVVVTVVDYLRYRCCHCVFVACCYVRVCLFCCCLLFIVVGCWLLVADR